MFWQAVHDDMSAGELSTKNLWQFVLSISNKFFSLIPATNSHQFMTTGLLERLDVEKDEDPPRLLRFLVFYLFDPNSFSISFFQACFLSFFSSLISISFFQACFLSLFSKLILSLILQVILSLIFQAHFQFLFPSPFSVACFQVHFFPSTFSTSLFCGAFPLGLLLKCLFLTSFCPAFGTFAGFPRSSFFSWVTTKLFDPIISGNCINFHLVLQIWKKGSWPPIKQHWGDVCSLFQNFLIFFNKKFLPSLCLETLFCGYWQLLQMHWVLLNFVWQTL